MYGEVAERQPRGSREVAESSRQIAERSREEPRGAAERVSRQAADEPAGPLSWRAEDLLSSLISYTDIGVVGAASPNLVLPSSLDMNRRPSSSSF